MNIMDTHTGGTRLDSPRKSSRVAFKRNYISVCNPIIIIIITPRDHSHLCCCYILVCFFLLSSSLFSPLLFSIVVQCSCIRSSFSNGNRNAFHYYNAMLFICYAIFRNMLMGFQICSGDLRVPPVPYIYFPYTRPSSPPF